MTLVEDFNNYRARMNEKILSKGLLTEEENNTVLKWLFNLNTHAFAAGAVNAKTKELVGLSSSMVLRCDDCVRYHLSKCHELGITTAEVFEIFSIANLIGGTIVIPHLRRAVEYWEALQNQ